MKRLSIALCALAFVGCGDASHTVSVTLTRAANPDLDPYAANVGLEKVRVVLDGVEATDRTIAELGLEDTAVTFDGYPELNGARVSAFGYDAAGNVVAFARRDGLSVTEDLDLSLPLRRNLAYVTHRANPAQDAPQSALYVIDLTTRGLVSKLRLPGTSPTARSVSNRGGAAILVTVEDQGQGAVFVLSADDHSTTRIGLDRPQDVTLGVEGSPVGVVLGGGVVTFVDLDAGAVLGKFSKPVGGRVVDAVITPDGRTALAVIDVTPGLIQIDLEAQDVTSLNVIPDPGGVALGADGRVAYVTSSTDKQVVAVDLENGRTRPYPGFVKGVGKAAFADEIEAVLALDIAPDNGAGRVLTFLVPSEQALGVDEGVRTLPFPTGIAMDGAARRAVVVAAGTSTETAGLTVVEATPAAVVGASALYPTDPEDRYFEGPLELGQRYQPSDVAVLYGR